jgi:predicted restriction endonuclease
MKGHQERADCEEAAREDGIRLLKQQAVVVAIDEEFDRGPAPRVRTVIQRRIRDTQEAKMVKELHNSRCQICGKRIALPDGTYYAEAHHIRPLGSDGPDRMENILCLCPNHHVALDYRCIRIKKAKLHTHPDHRISDEHIAYHNALCTDDWGG